MEMKHSEPPILEKEDRQWLLAKLREEMHVIKEHLYVTGF